jgi:predicted transcriptional regulator
MRRAVKIDDKIYQDLKRLSKEEGHSIVWLMNRAVALFIENRRLERIYAKKLRVMTNTEPKNSIGE